jgi:hypothetical protein
MMARIANWLVVLVLIPATALVASACGSACEDLAHRICNCQPTRAQRDRCRVNVDAAARNFDLSDEQEDRCQAILDSGDCNCEALLAGDFAACGLSYDPAAEP